MYCFLVVSAAVFCKPSFTSRARIAGLRHFRRTRRLDVTEAGANLLVVKQLCGLLQLLDGLIDFTASVCLLCSRKQSVLYLVANLPRSFILAIDGQRLV